MSALHAFDSVADAPRAKVLGRDTNATEPASRWAAAVMESAIAKAPVARVACTADVSATLFRRWMATGPAFLRLAWALKDRYPDAVLAFARGLESIVSPKHVARDPYDRIVGLLREVSEAAQEIERDREGGYDDEEKRRIRRELADVHAVVHAMERDLEV